MVKQDAVATNLAPISRQQSLDLFAVVQDLVNPRFRKLFCRRFGLREPAKEARLLRNTVRREYFAHR